MLVSGLRRKILCASVFSLNCHTDFCGERTGTRLLIFQLLSLGAIAVCSCVHRGRCVVPLCSLFRHACLDTTSFSRGKPLPRFFECGGIRRASFLLGRRTLVCQQSLTVVNVGGALRRALNSSRYSSSMSNQSYTVSSPSPFITAKSVLHGHSLYTSVVEHAMQKSAGAE